jgi:hypothetical protein
MLSVAADSNADKAIRTSSFAFPNVSSLYKASIFRPTLPISFLTTNLVKFL